MRKNVKNMLMIIPIILLLCFSFINVTAYATDKLDSKSTKTTKATKVTTEDSSNQDAKKTNSKSSTSTNKATSFGPNSAGPAGINGDVISDKDNKEEDINSDINTEENVVVEENLPAWKKIDGKLHYVTEDGIVEETGWFKEKDENPDADNDNEYYLDDNYAATIGWKEFSGSWYYFNESGVKQTGWVLVDYNWYHFDENGMMETGWIKVDGYTYYLNESGIMSTGKKYLNGKWMFFASNGMLETGIYANNNKRYYSTKEGEMVSNEWVKIGSRKYYVKADSSLATGNVIIDGKMESFDLDGEYIGTEDMSDHLFIKFLNVGNADCAYIKLPSGETVLIDTGDPKTSTKLVNFLNEQDLNEENGEKVIDYVILTHGHSDHIGGTTAVLDNFKVKKVYMPENARMKNWYAGVDPKTVNTNSLDMLKEDYKVYVNMMNYLKKKNIELTDTVRGDYIDKNNILQFVQSDKDFGPIGSDKLLEDYWGINENSAIVYLDYDDLQVLFTGDMEWNSEKDFWKSDLLKGREVDVLKVPHHGHNTSSTYDFIRYLSPSLGVISRAAENINKETIESDSLATGNDAYKNLIANGVTIYETSQNDGVSIYATEDGWNLEN